ncbi:hypothetical protein KHA94_06040 [Bacillus sp. FJAT-49705]|uniref:Histidine kinase domain-containing protein n=1 Tax=Cytobacillus citreus TaxID=2833586 RepID=A0ABS5NRK0_9BACI|nr:ATP-binding protein [Cytobacillus citreus]MBS4189768.1 hypothetical protein [Cytobacillus citreus]
MKNRASALGLLSILFVLGITGYFTVIVLKFPLVGMEVKKNNNQWIIEKIYKNGWASNQPIEEGEILELVDGKKPEEHSTVILFNRVEMANFITIMDENLEIKTISISYDHLDTQYINYLILPFLFSITTLSLSIFLYRRKKDDKSARILIYFLLSTGISYLSASVSARGEIVGRVLNTITLPVSLIIFVHFLKSYLLRFNLVFIKAKSLVILYILYFIFLSLMVSSYVFLKPNFHTKIIQFQLLFFLILISYLLIHLIRFYLKFKSSEGNTVLKILGITLFSAFSPFACLYVIPNILFKKELVSAETTAIFLIVIPIVFVYLQLAEKLFDIEFLLSRLRYYSLLSLPFTAFIVLFLSLILNIELFSGLTFIIFFLLLTCTTIFLYVKEYLDYKLRHHLFSQKSGFETSLYTFFQRAKYETKVTSLINSLINEIKDVLMTKSVFYFEVATENGGVTWLLKNRSNFPPSFTKGLEKIKWNNHRIGSLNEVLDGFGIVIGGDYNHKHIIFFGMKKSKTNINIQERIWLETLAYFSSILLENFQLIEGLFEKIEDYKGKKEIENGNYPYWFSRLMFSLSEKERANLSIDLHDSVLQDQLQLLREVEKIKGKVTDISIKNDLFKLRERMLDNIHLIRETCNELRPPFLSELGIIQSIQNLIDQTKLRSNFILKSELDQSIKILNKEYELTLYRVVQELLTNAMKHSSASEVTVALRKNNQTLTLIYSDNGKGIDMTKLNDSFKTMGIFGIKERIKSIGGTIEINSTSGKGILIFIKIKTGGSVNDKSFNCG